MSVTYDYCVDYSDGEETSAIYTEADGQATSLPVAHTQGGVPHTGGSGPEDLWSGIPVAIIENFLIQQIWASVFQSAPLTAPLSPGFLDKPGLLDLDTGAIFPADNSLIA